MAHKSVEIVQINLHNSKSASAVLCETLAGVQTAIALIQEPWFVNGVVTGLGGCGRIFHSNFQGKKIRTCVLVKGAQATFVHQQSGEDITAVKLKVLTEKNEAPEFIAGSAYLLYDSMERPPTREVEELVKKLKDERGKEPTFTDWRRHEVLVITICTTGMARWAKDWRVSKDPSGSEHSQIRLSLKCESEQVPRRNTKDTNWGNYREETFVRIQDVPSRFRNKRDLEHAAERLGEVIRDSYENNCTIKRPRNTKMVG
ncbi:uncharacterized protein [Fopius arisanus]|uniref:Uncharacterized protein n=1 Tax=Fopius arisanus TaxID=64838 RepID=A0A9R1TPF7_9HYME|nr:PREDICTED: uncharacterized protein LOC105272728 [Fopius arisanus]